MSYTRQQFINKIAPLAQTDMRNTGILASLTIAQACLESANGNSGLTLKANNLFGIKGTYNGQKQIMPTTEYYNGKKCTVQAVFRKYPSWEDSIADHSDLFLRYDRYKNLRGLKDYKLACQYVRQDGYATDPHYTALLLKIIEDNKLYRYDKEEPTEDKELSGAVQKIILSGIKINFNSWKRIDLINLNNVPSLLDKLGGLDSLAAKGIIANKQLWLTRQYNVNHIRSLLIKYSNTLG